MKISKEKIEELVDRLRSACAPEKVILFGSAATDDMHPNSDLDVMVIVPCGTPKREAGQKCNRSLIGFGIPVDIIVIDSDDLKRYQNNPATVIYPATNHGKLIYAA